MSQHLRTQAWLTGERYGIADIALFAYTQSAGDIGYEIDVHVADCFARVKVQPGYVPIRQ